MNKISDFMRIFQNAIYIYIKKVYKTATKNGDVVASGLLADVLRRGEIRLGENIGGIIVEYEMPIDVGNEAQGKTVSFDIILSAQRISE